MPDTGTIDLRERAHGEPTAPTSIADRLPVDRRSAAEPAGARPATTVPLRDDRAPVQRRRSRGSNTASLLNIAGAGLASFSVTMLLFGRLAPFSGLVAFMVVAYVLFIALYAVLVSLSEDEQGVRDRLMTAIMVSAASLTASALVFIVLFIVYRGRQALAHLNFFTQDLSRAASQQPLTVGGITHAIVGPLWMISIALVLTVPLGLVAAVYLNEVGGRFARFVRTIVEAMTALPSIIAGLFIFATWI